MDSPKKRHTIIPTHQSGFRSLHLTVSALLEATDDWTFNIYRGNVNSVIFPSSETQGRSVGPGEIARQLGTIIQSIFCAQSVASIRLTVWKWSGESRYPGAFAPVLENFCRAISPGPTDRPWVSEDVVFLDLKKAFDTVGYDILLSKMNLYGIQRTVLY